MNDKEKKRFYDMAAETSVDAKVPVALALAKLALVFAVKNVEDLRILIGNVPVDRDEDNEILC